MSALRKQFKGRGGSPSGVSSLPLTAEGNYEDFLQEQQSKSAHIRTDRKFSNDRPLDVSDAPFSDPRMERITYLTFDDVLCRLPGRNFSRLERFSPIDEAWVWYGPHHQEVALRGKRLDEKDALAMATRLYENRDESDFSEESMPRIAVDMIPPNAFGTFMPGVTLPNIPSGVDPDDFAEFLRQQAEKKKAQKGPGHTCILPGFDDSTMICTACQI